jgi:hypothetical protein
MVVQMVSSTTPFGGVAQAMRFFASRAARSS